MVELEFGAESRSSRGEACRSATWSTTNTYGLAWYRTHVSAIRDR